jgi:hypothetical protein
VFGKVNLPPAFGTAQFSDALTCRRADVPCHAFIMELVFALYLVHPLFDVRKAKHSMVEGTPPSQMPGSARIEALSGIEFEKVIATLLERMGFHAQMTKASGDGGIRLCLAEMIYE